MKFFFFISVIVLLMGCKDEYTICDMNKEVVLKGGFYKADVLYAVPLFSLKLSGANYPIYNEAAGVSNFRLPLNPLTDSAVYEIKTSQNSTPDTLTIIYSTTNLNLSAACGNINVHTLTKASVTSHTLKGVKIINPDVSPGSTENLKLFF